MSEFRLMQTADRSPTQCAFCHTHVGPFIDTNIEMPGYGTVLICVASEERLAGCLEQMGALVGLSNKAEGEMIAAALRQELNAMKELNKTLVAKKYIKLAEVLPFIEPWKQVGGGEAVSFRIVQGGME